VLALRLQACLPTLFQLSQNHCYLFEEKGVSAYQTDSERISEIKSLIPDLAWILVDSNENIRTMPSYLWTLGFYFIQATQYDCTAWKTKVKSKNPPITYWMKAWSLWELIIG
jgi:hypothetical protein